MPSKFARGGPRKIDGGLHFYTDGKWYLDAECTKECDPPSSDDEVEMEDETHLMHRCPTCDKYQKHLVLFIRTAWKPDADEQFFREATVKCCECSEISKVATE